MVIPTPTHFIYRSHKYINLIYESNQDDQVSQPGELSEKQETHKIWWNGVTTEIVLTPIKHVPMFHAG